MGKQEFDNYLRTHTPAPGQLPEQLIDWETEQRDWLSRLAQLYADIEQWLADYQRSGLVQLAFRPIRLFEDGIGEYSVNEVEICVGGELAKLVPVGTALVGVKGRVDLEGPNDTVRLVLAHQGATRPSVTYRKRLYASPADEARVRQFWQDEGMEQMLADDWVWKVSTNPPHIKYTDLTQDSFLGSLLQVIGGQAAN